MVQAVINNGTVAGDGQGESLFSAFDKTNANFDELYANIITQDAAIAAASSSGAVTSVAGKTGVVALVKADVGLGNVDNTTDASVLATAAAAADAAIAAAGTAFYATYASLPVTGVADKLYAVADKGSIYKWTGTAYATTTLMLNDAATGVINPETGATLLFATSVDQAQLNALGYQKNVANGVPGLDSQNRIVFQTIIPEVNTLANLLADTRKDGGIAVASDSDSLILRGLIGGAFQVGVKVYASNISLAPAAFPSASGTLLLSMPFKPKVVLILAGPQSTMGGSSIGFCAESSGAIINGSSYTFGDNVSLSESTMSGSAALFGDGTASGAFVELVGSTGAFTSAGATLNYTKTGVLNAAFVGEVKYLAFG